MIELQRSRNAPYIWIQTKLDEQTIKLIDIITSYTIIGHEYSNEWALGNWDGKEHLLRHTKAGDYFFPEGLLTKVIQILNLTGHQTHYIPRQPPREQLNKTTWNGPTLREYQLDTLNQMKMKLDNGEGVIACLPTGSGKSNIAMKLIHELRQKTLITVHNKELMKQWQKNIEKTLDYTTTILGGGNKDTNKAADIMIAMIQTLTKDKKIKLDEYNTVVFDECHHYSSKTFNSVAMRCNAYYRIGLSATPKREDGADLKFIGGIGKIITPITAQELMDLGYIVKPKLIVLRPPSPAKLGRTYADEYRNGIVMNEARNQMIANEIRRYADNGDKVYVSVTQLAQGKRLETLSGAKFVDSKSKTRDRDIQDFIDGKTNTIISTLLGEGIDIPAINILIMAGAGKSEIATIQKAGRILRPSQGKNEAIIVDFADSGKRLRQHYMKRRETYKTVFGI
jgi:superfamily II DNA or RNA helicase